MLSRVSVTVVPRSEARRARRAASSSSFWDCPRLHRQQTLPLQLFAGELTGTADGFRLLPYSPFGRFFVMAAELHFAEDALALHLLLQHPKGLVDIVVTYENLHAAFLLDRAIDGPDGQGARPTGIRSCTMPTVPSESSRNLKFAPADRHLAANWEKRRIRYVAVFWPAHRTSQSSLAYPHQYWCVGAKHNGSQPFYVLWHTLNSSMSCVVGCRRDDSINQLQKL